MILHESSVKCDSNSFVASHDMLDNLVLVDSIDNGAFEITLVVSFDAYFIRLDDDLFSSVGVTKVCFDESPFMVFVMAVMDGGDDVAAFVSSLSKLDSFFFALK